MLVTGFFNIRSMKRTFVIGDIHGGLKALLQVFERANITTDDKLIFLKDYVDGWSESAQVLEYLIELQHKNECVFIKGNHDMWCEEWLRSGDTDEVWLRHGGLATIASYATLNFGQRATHINFLERMEYFFIDEFNRLFIHAGFTSSHGPEKEFRSGNFSWDRSLWETAISVNGLLTKNSLLYPKRMKLFHEIYIGHTPTLYYGIYVPMQAGNVWNIDTGAAFTGKLSVIDINSKEFWQSDFVSSLYPGEKGRNESA